MFYYLWRKTEESHASIRKACVEVITKISKYSSSFVKNTFLVPIYKKFLIDNNKEVRK